MSVRKRTTKIVAKRHDLNYFKRMSRVRAWQWWLAAAAVLAAGLWFGTTTLVRGGTLLSAGPMSSSHAVFGERCEVCHVPVVEATSWTPALGMRRHVPDAACLRCHVAEPHHPAESALHPRCSSCHEEHVGAMHLAATKDAGCSQCHAHLETRGGAVRIAREVSSFAGNHPEFRLLRTSTESERAAATALVFNHAEHLKAGLKGVNGPVTLTCASCHTATVGADGRQGDGMQPVKFETSCRSCHSLEFDGHVRVQAPHTTPEAVHAFVEASLTEFARQHPEVVAAEIRAWPQQKPLPGMAVGAAAPRNAQEWLQASVMRSETILWREKCGLCHKSEAGAREGVPKYETVSQPAKWMPVAVFSHPAHRAVACADCHTQALTATGEHAVLMPTIATCRRCHDGQSSPQGPALANGHAESGCFLCHTYHGEETAALTVKGWPLAKLARK
jgi:ribosomal protein S27E